MKTFKIMSIALSIAIVTLTMCALGAGCRSNIKTSSNQRAVASNVSRTIAELRRKHRQIPFGISPVDYQERHRRMQALLSEWTPVGTSSNELVYLLGPPTEPSSRSYPNVNRLGYRIDSGFAGAVWNFYIENNKVVRMETEGID